jgi:hypothetical protein
MTSTTARRHHRRLRAWPSPSPRPARGRSATTRASRHPAWPGRRWRPRRTCATPDNRAPGVTPTRDPRNTSNGLPAQRPRTVKPVAIEIQPASPNDDGPPLLVFILPSLALIAIARGGHRMHPQLALARPRLDPQRSRRSAQPRRDAALTGGHPGLSRTHGCERRDGKPADARVRTTTRRGGRDRRSSRRAAVSAPGPDDRSLLSWTKTSSRRSRGNAFTSAAPFA